jgi:hypothetical protein
MRAEGDMTRDCATGGVRLDPRSAWEPAPGSLIARIERRCPSVRRLDSLLSLWAFPSTLEIAV